MGYKTICERFSSDCGCAEHDIEMGHITATVHMEPDGSGEAFVFFGDWEEWSFEGVKDIEDLKCKTWAKLRSMPRG